VLNVKIQSITFENSAGYCIQAPRAP